MSDMVRRLSSYAVDILHDDHVTGSNREPLEGDPSRVYWSPMYNRNPVSWKARELVSRMQGWRSPRSQGDTAICIIENITIDWVDEIGVNMKIDRNFFVRHFNKNWNDRSQPWHWAVGPEQPQSAQLEDESRQWHCIDASFALPRQLRGELARTRISYYRLEKMYLFLVDSPPVLPAYQRARDSSRRSPHGRNRIGLRLKYSTLLGGVLLPALFYQQHPTYDLFGLMKDSMNYAWLRDCLFVDSKPTDGRRLRAVRAHPFVYVLIDAAWTRNLRYLTNEVKDISFANVEKPHRDALMAMHELREDLDYAKGEIAKAVRYAPPTLADYFERSASSEWYQRDGLPLVFLKEMENDAAALDEFLTNSLNLLLASIALRDSQRADMLTWLAAVYVPLSFVTGIFGMNLRELNDSALPVWICLEVLGVVLLVTAVLVVAYKLWEKYSGVLSKNTKRGLESGLY